MQSTIIIDIIILIVFDYDTNSVKLRLYGAKILVQCDISLLLSLYSILPPVFFILSPLSYLCTYVIQSIVLVEEEKGKH